MHSINIWIFFAVDRAVLYINLALILKRFYRSSYTIVTHIALLSHFSYWPITFSFFIFFRNQKTIDHKVTTVQFIFFKKVIWHNPKSSAWNFLIQHFSFPFLKIKIKNLYASQNKNAYRFIIVLLNFLSVFILANS